MTSVSGQDDDMILWINLATAISYYVIASQFLFFVCNPKIVKVFRAADDAKGSTKRRIFQLLLATAVLLICFILLCGTGHLMIGVSVLYPGSVAVKEGQVVVAWLLMIVAFSTAIVGFPLFPTIASALQGLELSSDGKIQLAGSYLIEVVDLIKESILVLSDDLVVRKCNDVSKVLFGSNIVGSDICQYIHPTDLPLFTDAIAQAAESYTFGSTTVEVRIEHGPSSAASPKFNPQRQEKQSKNHKKGKNYRVHTTEETPFEMAGDIEMGEATPLNADREAQSAHEDYIWIEVTVCRGQQQAKVNGVPECDIKLVCRNIDDRKKRQAFQALVESTE